MNIRRVEVLSHDGKVLMVMPIDRSSEDLSQKENRKNILKRLTSLPIKDEISSIVFYSSSGYVIDKIHKDGIGINVSIHV